MFSYINYVSRDAAIDNSEGTFILDVNYILRFIYVINYYRDLLAIFQVDGKDSMKSHYDK